MDMMLVLKAGFMGFAVSLGVQMLVFFVAGRFLGASGQRFVRVFMLAAVASFLAVDLLLYYRIRVLLIPEPQAFLAGCLGGWLGGIISGVTQFKKLLAGFLR
jgi:hypothetical protein